MRASVFGTRQWPTRTVAWEDAPRFCYAVEAAVPPARLGIVFHRVPTVEAGVATSGANRASLFDEEPYASFVESAIVDTDVSMKVSGGGECQYRLGCPTTGSWVEYVLPFTLQITAFSFGFSNCGADGFKDWAFEAFDGEEWRQIYYSAHSPWSEPLSHATGARLVCFRLSDTDFASTRFRIRLLESNRRRCTHVRGLELYGTILPPWRLD